MNNSCKASTFTTCLLFLSAASNVASTAEIKVLSPIALEYVLVPLAPEFEQTSGHKLTISYGTAGAIAGRIAKEAVDVGMTAAPLIDNLHPQSPIPSP